MLHSARQISGLIVQSATPRFAKCDTGSGLVSVAPLCAPQLALAVVQGSALQPVGPPCAAPRHGVLCSREVLGTSCAVEGFEVGLVLPVSLAEGVEDGQMGLPLHAPIYAAETGPAMGQGYTGSARNSFVQPLNASKPAR